MNFLSHYTVHHNSEPVFNFGLLFPDFLGIISRGYKLKQFKKDFGSKNTHFLNGIAHHELADALWHESIFFREKCAGIKKILNDFGFVDKPFRPFFMSHVMLEILLDRTIVLKEERLTDDMYTSLEAVEKELIENINEIHPATREFGRFFANFRSNRYVFSYGSNEMFIYALNRLFSRVNHPQLIFEDDSQRDNFVHKLDTLIIDDYHFILEVIRNERVQ